MTNTLTQSLGLKPMEDDEPKNLFIRKRDAEIIENEESTELVPSENKSEDFLKAKQNIRDLIELGTASVADLFEIARSSQNSKDYLALTTLIKTMLEANREVIDIENVDLDIQKKKKQLAADKDDHSNSEKGVTHNTIVFTGTSEDMLRQIEQLKKK